MNNNILITKLKEYKIPKIRDRIKKIIYVKEDLKPFLMIKLLKQFLCSKTWIYVGISF